MKNTYKEIDGWCEEEITTLYDKAIKEFKDDSIFVELGCYKGKSTCYMIDAIKKSNKKIHFYVVDNFSLEDVENEFKENLGEERLKSITLINEDSLTASKYFTNNSIDFIFIDTIHNAEQLSNELYYWNPKIKENGLISGHDFTHCDLKNTFDILDIPLYNVIFSHLIHYECTTSKGTFRNNSWWYIK